MHVLYLSMLCPHNCNKTLLTEVDLNWWDKIKNNTSSSILCVCACVCTFGSRNWTSNITPRKHQNILMSNPRSLKLY